MSQLRVALVVIPLLFSLTPVAPHVSIGQLLFRVKQVGYCFLLVQRVDTTTKVCLVYSYEMVRRRL